MTLRGRPGGARSLAGPGAPCAKPGGQEEEAFDLWTWVLALGNCLGDPCLWGPGTPLASASPTSVLVAAVTGGRRLGASDDRCLFSRSCGGRKFKIKVRATSRSLRRPRGEFFLPLAASGGPRCAGRLATSL